LNLEHEYSNYVDLTSKHQSWKYSLVSNFIQCRGFLHSY